MKEKGSLLLLFGLTTNQNNIYVYGVLLASGNLKFACAAKSGGTCGKGFSVEHDVLRFAFN